MSTSAGRRPNASAQMITPGCDPVVGWTNTASHDPSGVVTVTFSFVTGSAAADTRVSAAAAMPMPAAIESATKSRRDRSFFSSAIMFLLDQILLDLPPPEGPARRLTYRPDHSGLRFDTNAVTPSRKSALV